MTRKKNIISIAYDVQDKLMKSIIEINRYNRNLQNQELIKVVSNLHEILELITGFRP